MFGGFAGTLPLGTCPGQCPEQGQKSQARQHQPTSNRRAGQPHPPVSYTHLDVYKRQVDMGAEFIVTQMFFDNNKYIEFVKKCRENDIHVPIIPGLKPITSSKQLISLPKVFHIDLPEDLSEAIQSVSYTHLYAIRKNMDLEEAEKWLSPNLAY